MIPGGKDFDRKGLVTLVYAAHDEVHNDAAVLRDILLGWRSGRCHLIRGSVVHWWNGGGDESIHSNVVAPTPHGLAPASRFFAKAS